MLPNPTADPTAAAIMPIFRFDNVSFPDAGFGVSFGLELALSFLLCFIISATFAIPFCSGLCFFSVLVLTIIFITVRLIRKEVIHTLFFNDREEFVKFLFGFAVFSLVFIVAFYIKGFKPEIGYQTEQYMDFGFMQKMYRQQKLPPTDLWFDGKVLNYYYFGHAAAVFLCRLSFTTPDCGYNLSLCTCFACIATATFSLVYGLLNSKTKNNRVSNVLGGLVASIMCSLGGNTHYLRFGLFERIYNLFLGRAGEHYWFPTSTQYIGNVVDVSDVGKHEFPAFSVVLGDLHAHVINIIFTMPLLAILIDYCLKSAGCLEKSDYRKEDGRISFNKIRNEIYSPHILLLSVLLGLFRGVNYWDFPIYFVVSGAVILFCDLKKTNETFTAIVVCFFKGMFILICGYVVMFPFENKFVKMMGGIFLCDKHSDIVEFMLVWGAHITIVLMLIIYLLVLGFMRRKKGIAMFDCMELTILAFVLCGLGLIFLPEVVYVKDIYGEDYERYNTMFKLTYQGFILMGLGAGCFVGMMFDSVENVQNAQKTFDENMLKVFGGIVFVVAILLSGYSVNAVRGWFGTRLVPKLRIGISAIESTCSSNDFCDVYEAISIINQDERKNISIMEEAGTSYSPECRIAVFTGASDILGWYGHEQMWRNIDASVSERKKEIANFYSCGFEDYCKGVVHKYDLDYVYVGKRTTEKYAVNYDGFENLGEHVWESNDGKYMLIKINKD